MIPSDLLIPILGFILHKYLYICTKYMHTGAYSNTTYKNRQTRNNLNVQKQVMRCSCCGATGSVASWEPWDAGSIPGQAQQVKDLALLQLQLRSGLISGQGPPHVTGQPKKKKKKNADELNNRIGFIYSLSRGRGKLILCPLSWCPPTLR